MRTISWLLGLGLMASVAVACSDDGSEGGDGGESGSSGQMSAGVAGSAGQAAGKGGAAGTSAGSGGQAGGSPAAGASGQSGGGAAGSGTAGGQAGSGQAGGGATGGQAGSGQAGGGAAGAAGAQAGGQAGSGEAGSGQAGSEAAGSGQAGSEAAGSGQAGSGTAGSGQAGSGQAGSGQAGSGQAGTGANPPDEPPGMEGMTAAHNAVRAGVTPAANPPIPELTWDTKVAAAAQAWADKCTFKHSSSSYGENIYATSGSSTPQGVVDSWAKEAKNYTYASNSCSGTCGHYTQIVWRDSKRLGCGRASCTTGSPFGNSKPWEMWVCNYDPPGNFNGKKPY